jgi:hypothetical protein
MATEGGAAEEIHLKRGDSPMEVVKEFAEKHGADQPSIPPPPFHQCQGRRRLTAAHLFPLLSDRLALILGMEDDQAQLTARALARAQLEGAYASELDRRAIDDQALARPALFNLSLAVRESDEDDEDDDSLRIHIAAGQTPMEATNAFVEASDVPISTEVARKIAVRLLEDQRALAW